MVGLASIEDIRPGDYVYAENTETGEQAYMPVLETFSHEVSETYTVTIEGESIETTSGHPFYVVEEGWVGADELEAGDEVELADGGSGTIDSVEKNELDEPVTVYNFAVMDYHTYYVGENGALVHNKCNADVDTPNAGGSGGQALAESGSATPKTIPQQLTQDGQVPVIGKMKDLNTSGNVIDGEFRIADYLPDMGNPQANWHQNSGILRRVMNEGVSIKDVSMYPMNNAGFLGAERNLLQSRGWTYFEGYWNPPK